MKSYAETQILAALDAIAAGHGTIKPSNLSNRFEGMVQAATPALLADLADAFAVVASKHPGELGVFVQSLAAEILAEHFARQTARKD